MGTFLNPAYIYGPVHSRRLGISLGVNLNPADGKHCSFDCIYCELGTNAQRRTKSGFPAAKDIAGALEAKLRKMDGEGLHPDVITLAGNGEPTANPEFPDAVDAACALRDEICPEAKVGVLSNATFAHLPQVHAALEKVDDNILKLDTVDPAFIAQVDRPVGPYDVEQVIETLASFKGHVIVQTIFFKGEMRGVLLDDTGDAYVEPWLAALERIRPSGVMVYTIARETPFHGLQKASHKELDSIKARVEERGFSCTVAY